MSTVCLCAAHFKLEHTLKLGAAEILENLLPVRRIIVSTQVWFELATENLQSSTLPDTVCSYQTQNLPRTWCGQSMQLEAVRRVTVGHLGFQIGGEIDDMDGTERTLLGADTTSDAKAFGNKGDLGFRRNFDAELAGPNHRARFFAFLPTFLVRSDYDPKYPSYIIFHMQHTLGLHCTCQVRLGQQSVSWRRGAVAG